MSEYHHEHHEYRHREPGIVESAGILAAGLLPSSLAVLCAVKAMDAWTADAWRTVLVIGALVLGVPGLFLTGSGIAHLAAAIAQGWQNIRIYRARADRENSIADREWIDAERQYDLWQQERLVGRDIDGDGVIGRPKSRRPPRDIHLVRAVLKWCYLQADGDFGQRKGRRVFGDDYDWAMNWLSDHRLISRRTKGEMGYLAFGDFSTADTALSSAWTGYRPESNYVYTEDAEA